MIDVVMFLVALVLFVLAAVNMPSRINLIAAGLAFAVVPPLLHAIRALG